jgi:hypothetical protein
MGAAAFAAYMDINANRKEAGVDVIMFPSTFCTRSWHLA